MIRLGMENGLNVLIWMTGRALGSKDNAECRIDSIAQSWSAISGAGDKDKVRIAVNSLEQYLVNKEVRNY